MLKRRAITCASSYTARTSYDSLYLALDGLYTGTPLDIVLAMKRTSIFGESIPLVQYLTFHRDRIKRLHGVEITVTGETPDAQAASFLEALLSLGVVRRLLDWTPEGETDHE